MDKIKDVLNKKISYMVTNKDLMKKLHGFTTKVIVYSDLENVESLFDILPEDQSCCFILIRTSDNSGHWTVIVRHYFDIYYMDSYGIKPDGELKNVPKSDKYELGETRPILSHLIYDMPLHYNFEYNKTQFQQYSKNNGISIDTCGKWTSTFAYCILNGLTLNDYVQRMHKFKIESDLSYDQCVCLLYDSI